MKMYPQKYLRDNLLFQKCMFILKLSSLSCVHDKNSNFMCGPSIESKFTAREIIIERMRAGKVSTEICLANLWNCLAIFNWMMTN